MLAPKVQATTIEDKGTPGVGWESMALGEPPRLTKIYAPSAFTSANEAGTARALAQSLSS